MMTTAVAPMPVISVDDHPLMGDVISTLVAQLPGFRHLKHFSSGEGVYDFVTRDGVKIVVLDYEIPGTDTLGLLRRIVEDCPQCRVVMLSAHARPEIVEECRRAGAAGYVSKTLPPAQIAPALRRAGEDDRGGGPEFFTMTE